jgi:hypothetical protein
MGIGMDPDGGRYHQGGWGSNDGRQVEKEERTAVCNAAVQTLDPAGCIEELKNLIMTTDPLAATVPANAHRNIYKISYRIRARLHY